ncbi:hypothetical protein [Paraflavitalea speifideaquila]|uniref:hypothetical protein n=1 Tax=Paraflavitalea speifideaquila TaxID=3076558 RepID=UPI0028E6CD45|nr:hypothetical protein [Paraflavitalea speifideiaquila]
MREKTKNPKFEYEISCDQMCGNGHYSMRGVIKVVTPEEFILWKAKMKPAYATAFPAPEAPKPVVADSTAKSAKDTLKTVAKHP